MFPPRRVSASREPTTTRCLGPIPCLTNHMTGRKIHRLGYGVQFSVSVLTYAHFGRFHSPGAAVLPSSAPGIVSLRSVIPCASMDRWLVIPIVPDQRRL